MKLVKIKRAIISVSDKTGIVDFAKELESGGTEIISTGGTYRLLKENGINVTEVSEVTGFPEMLDGRVKTLHPKIHAGILARRDDSDHMKALSDVNIDAVDMVVVNLYPFKETVMKNSSFEDIVENIDIGGPSMIRAAAKNYKSVTVVTDKSQYQLVLDDIKENGEVKIHTLEKLMAEAFVNTANYDAMIAEKMLKQFGEGFPQSFPVPMEKVDDLRYGENPNQKAAYYTDPFTEGPTVSKSEQLHGKQLSFNNILDLDKALDIAMDFKKPTAVVMKHTNPCGLASDDNSISEAFITAYNVDPMSAYGCIIALNRNCDLPTAEEIKKYFVEAIICPEYDDDALELLKTKKNLRLLRTGIPIGPDYRHRDYKMKKVKGGMLIQTDEDVLIDPENLEVVTERAPTDKEIHSLMFAWKLAKHVTSNAVVYVKDERAVGIGAGQMSRVDSAKIAAMKANESTDGCVMASDAFFPFRDGVDTAAEAGITAIIQPGGSIRDQEVIDAANEHGIAMVFTGCRVFRH